jgi:hypothetical protein
MAPRALRLPQKNTFIDFPVFEEDLSARRRTSSSPPGLRRPRVVKMETGASILGEEETGSEREVTQCSDSSSQAPSVHEQCVEESPASPQFVYDQYDYGYAYDYVPQAPQYVYTVPMDPIFVPQVH